MSVLVVGGGPAGLMAAETLAAAGRAVTVIDHMPSLGRRLLMAGRGGLNLTHAEPLERLLDRYGPATAVRRAVAAFPPEAVRGWCHGLGQATFVGSSGRVFPTTMKASPLLRAWLARLAGLGVTLRPRRRWRGPQDRDGMAAVVLACGGASWPRLGADGTWPGLLPECRAAPWRPANAGLRVAWSNVFRDRFAGTPLKRIALSVGAVTVRGEAVVTAAGLEGGAVYAMVPLLRDGGTLHVDLRPDLDDAALARRLGGAGGQSVSTVLRKAGLAPVAIGLVQQARHAGDSTDLRQLIRALPLAVIGAAGLDRAISSAGGLALDELDHRLMLRRHPGLFAGGEMLDWEAPTGGYLIQACLATGRAAGQGALDWLREQES